VNAEANVAAELVPGKKRRVRREPEAARTLILDVTQRLMLDEGYAAVSTRRNAKEAGLAAALVHYYFPTTDELFIALHRRLTDRQLEELRIVLASENPIRSLWEFQTTWTHASLGVEFMALANHRKAIREEIARRTESARDVQAELLEPFLNRSQSRPGSCNALSIATLLMGVARTLVNEESIGIMRGHEDVRALVEWVVNQVSPADAHPKPLPQAGGGKIRKRARAAAVRRR